MDGPSAELQIRRKISSGLQDNRSRENSHGMTISRPTGAQPVHWDASFWDKGTARWAEMRWAKD